MGYLNNAGLGYFFGKLKTIFAPISHGHGGATQSAAGFMSAADKKKLDGIAEGANKYSLPTATSNVLGGVKTGANITNNSGVLSVTAANVTNALGYTPPKQDTNTWRPVVNSLASSAADQSLAANQGKILNESKAAMIVLTNENLNDVVTPGFYSSGGGNSVTNKPSNVNHFGLIVIHRASGNYYTQIVYSDSAAYRRHCVNGTWSGWVQDKLTDTDTWRGIQNNLTSDSTTDSLSAAQGKALKALVDGKAAANHTHSQYLTAHQDISGKVDKSEAGANNLLATLTTTWTATPTDDTYFVRQDTGGGSTFGRVKFSTLWSYIKGKGDATYQPKGSYAASSHTHNYAGASSAGGSANSAVKLDTATAGSATQPVYFKGGKPAACSYTLGKSVPSNAVFTDTTYGVATASSNGLMSNGDKAKLDALGDIVTIQKSLKLTTDWMDTGIAGDNLSSGSYIVKISGLTTNSTGFYGEIFSGIMTWYDGETNSSESDEIPLHSAGHAQNGNKVYLRTSRRNRGNGNLHLQISAKYAGTAADTITFKFRKMI